MMRLRTCLLLTASCLIFSCWADVFVSTTGSDEGGDGSRIAPYRTVGLAVTRATPESTILIDCGEYHEQFTISKSLEIEGGWSGECKPAINGSVTLSTTSEQAIDISITNLQVSTTNQLVGQGGLFMGAGLGNIMLDSVAFDSRGVLRTDLDQVISVSTANSFRSLTLINCTANNFIMTYTGPPLTQQRNSRLSFISFRAEYTWLFTDTIEEIRMVDSIVYVMALRTRHTKRATPSVYVSHSVVFSSLQLESAAVTIHNITAYNATILLSRTAELYEPTQQERITWGITSSIFNSSGIVLLQQPLTQNCSISLRHNKFVGDRSVQSALDSSQDTSTPVIIRLKNSDGCWVDAKENWFGDLSGPTSCCNPAGTGSYLWPGVDASNWCLDENCNQISSHSQSSTCSIEAMCYIGEDYLFGLLGAVQFIVVFATVWRLLVLCRSPRKSDPAKPQLLAISGCLLAGSIVVAVAFVVFALKFSSNTPTLKLSGRWSVSLLIPVVISFVLLFLQGTFSLTVAVWRKGIVLFLVIGAMNTILSLVAIPVLYSTSPVLQSVMGYATFKLNVLFRLNTESTVFSLDIPYEIVLLFVFTLPMAIIQLRGIKLVWRLLVQCYYPDLHKLYAGVDETQSLLEKKDDIIRPGQLARPARILGSVAIPKLLLSIALVASLVALVIRIAPYLVRLDKQLVQYIGLAVVLAVTGSATAIPVVLFGGFTFFRRFYNSALLLAYVGLTVGLVGLNCFVVVVTVGFAISSGDKIFDAYYVDNENIHEFKSEMVAHTVGTTVLLGVQTLAQIGHATAAFIYRQRVVRELPSIMSDKIDNALDDIYEGR